MTWWHVLAFVIGVVVGAALVIVPAWIWLTEVDGDDESAGDPQ